LTNKYTMTFPYSEEELHDLYVNKFMSQAEIGKMFGISQKKVMSDMKKMKIEARVPYKRHQQGEQNSNWKGGRVLLHCTTPDGHRINSEKDQRKGYYMIKMHSHPSSDKQGYIFEHVHIALQAARRETLDKKVECVHHINMDKHDNHPDNLCIMSKQRHTEIHSALEIVIGKLVDKGVVDFNLERGYFIK